MIGSDVEVLKTFPECRAFFRDYAQVEEVLSIYPTLTYPCHASILTGCYPLRHGIVNNERLEPENPHPYWYWFSSFLKVPRIIDSARKSGLTTACVAWPLTAGADVDYLIAKVYAPKEMDDGLFNSERAKHIYDRNKHLLGSFSNVEVDTFAERCTSEIIEAYKPDLTFSYLMTIDHMRHKKGVDTSLHLDSLHFVAERLGKIAEAAKRAGIYEDTVFILVSDHGQIDVEKVFNINAVLKEKGYLETNGDGSIKDYRIWSRCCAFSGEIYLKDISREEVKKVLEEIASEYPGTIERIMTREECEWIYHTGEEFDLMVEGCTGVSIGKDAEGPFVQEPDPSDYRTSRATHGYAPEKGPKATMVLSGPGIRKNSRIKEARLIDEAPTILKMFGINMPNTDGNILEELLSKED